MDILTRKLLNHGDTCYFYTSSIEEPYTYLRFKGTIKEIYTVRNEQVVYRIEILNILENETIIQKYMNRNSYRGFDTKTNNNKVKTLFAFDSKTKSEFIKNKLKNSFLFECSSASVFETRKEMEDEFLKMNKYIVELLNETINSLLIR